MFFFLFFFVVVACVCLLLLLLFVCLLLLLFVCLFLFVLFVCLFFRWFTLYILLLNQQTSVNVEAGAGLSQSFVTWRRKQRLQKIIFIVLPVSAVRNCHSIQLPTSGNCTDVPTPTLICRCTVFTVGEAIHPPKL